MESDWRAGTGDSAGWRMPADRFLISDQSSALSFYSTYFTTSTCSIPSERTSTSTTILASPRCRCPRRHSRQAIRHPPPRHILPLSHLHVLYIRRLRQPPLVGLSSSSPLSLPTTPNNARILLLPTRPQARQRLRAQPGLAGPAHQMVRRARPLVLLHRPLAECVCPCPIIWEPVCQQRQPIRQQQRRRQSVRQLQLAAAEPRLRRRALALAHA